MKKLLILFTALFVTYQSQGQAYGETTRKMSQGENNSFTIDLSIGNAEAIADLWVDYQKDYKAKKPKLNKKTGEYFADNAEIRAISSNTIDIYSKVESITDKGAVVTVWFDLGGAYLSTTKHPERMAAAKAWMAGFENIVKVAFAEEALEAEEDRLKELEKELKNLEKEQKDAEKEVENLEEALRTAREQIAAKAKAVGEKKAEISLQEEAIDEVKTKIKKLEK